MGETFYNNREMAPTFVFSQPCLKEILKNVLSNMRGGTGKLESQEISRERSPRDAQSREQSVIWNPSLSSIRRVSYSPLMFIHEHPCETQNGRKGLFVPKNVIINVEGQRVESWHLCLPLSAAGQVPGRRHGGLGRAPPAAALSCPCWHSLTRR